MWVFWLIIDIAICGAFVWFGPDISIRRRKPLDVDRADTNLFRPFQTADGTDMLDSDPRYGIR